MNNRKGFTLVELLATIVVLSLVLGITAYVITNVIRNAKEKSYQVTIKNVEGQASNYLAENAGKLFFISKGDGKEYQCVTVQNLIDFGYLNDDITESLIADKTNVNRNDYIYLERNVLTKAITQSQYTRSNAAISSCNRAVQETSDISILINPDSGWAKQKTVTIGYKLKNVIDANELEKYLYGYTFDTQSLENREAQKEFVTVKNGTVTATIKYNDEVINIKSIDITGIDRTGPVISLGTYSAGTKSKEAVIPLVVTDFGSGVNTGSFTKEDLVITIGNNVLSNDKYTLTYKNANNYELNIHNNTFEGKVEIYVGADNVFDKIENGNEEIVLKPNITFINVFTLTLNGNGATTNGTANVIAAYDSSVISPSTITLPKREYTITYDANGTGVTMPNNDKITYTLNGWYIDSTGSDLIINNSTTPVYATSSISGYIQNGKWIGTSDKTLYAHWNAGYIKLPYLSYNSYRCTWNTKADGTGDTYDMGQSNFTTDKNLTLYAICTHTCCNTAISDAFNCSQYGGSTAFYYYKRTWINQTQVSSNFCVTEANSCNSQFGWYECNYTFTTPPATTSDNGSSNGDNFCSFSDTDNVKNCGTYTVTPYCTGQYNTIYGTCLSKIKIWIKKCNATCTYRCNGTTFSYDKNKAIDSGIEDCS